ncbi:hypothetical protein ACIBI9_31255 [Nonomuraea sp. NPDC050451]|uniref:hypothetical protein n=1 Tax=Nonomuraea sp. NPDC050451 TaxID=3364364 RepID=UPI0037943540
MRKALSGIMLAVLSLAFIVLTTGSGHAAVADVSNLSLGRTGYNTPGADTYWTRNDEYQDVTNTGATAVDVNGLVFVDSWGKANNEDGVGCNAYKVTSVPGGAGSADGTGTGTFLPAGHTLRIYVGAGTPAFDGSKRHYVYMNSNKVCGYNGHVFNNFPRETLWIGLGGSWKSKTYDFSGGYYA